jgi:hypothetical protein
MQGMGFLLQREREELVRFLPGMMQVTSAPQRKDPIASLVGSLAQSWVSKKLGAERVYET